MGRKLQFTPSEILPPIFGLITLVAILWAPFEWITSIKDAGEYSYAALSQVTERVKYAWPIAVGVLWAATVISGHVTTRVMGFARPMLLAAAVIVASVLIGVWFPILAFLLSEIGGPVLELAGLFGMVTLFAFVGDRVVVRFGGSGIAWPSRWTGRLPLHAAFVAPQILISFVLSVNLEAYYGFI